MATMSFVSSTTTSITFRMNLDHPANEYDYFRWTLKDSGGTTTIDGPWDTGDSSSGTTTEYTFTGLNPSTTYRGYGELSYFGAPASAGFASGSTKTPPSPPTNISVSVSGKTATITFTKGANSSTTEADYYWVAGFPNASTSVSSLTVTAPNYSTSYDFDLRGVSSDGLSTSNWSTTTTFVTGPPPAPTAPTSITSVVTGNSVTISYTKGTDADFTEITYEVGANPDTIPETDSSISSINLTVLQWNSTYNYQLRSTNVTGNSTWTTVKSFTIGPQPVPGTPAAPTFGTRFEGSINVSWGSTTNVEQYQLEYTDSSAHTFYFTPTSARIYYLNSQGAVGTPELFNYGTQYSIRVRAYNSGAAGGIQQFGPWSGSNVGTTNPKQPGLSLWAAGQTYFDVTVSGMDSNAGGWDKVEVYRKATATGSVLETQIVTVNDTIVRFNASGAGLTPNTTYYVEAKAFLLTSGGTTIFNINQRQISVSTSNLPVAWLWTTGQDGSGHKTSGSNFTMLASEWNAFTTRINDFRIAKALTAYGFTSASSGSNFLASMFNQARTAISEITTRTTPLTAGVKNSGDPINAADLNNLMDSLNSTQ